MGDVATEFEKVSAEARKGILLIIPVDGVPCGPRQLIIGGVTFHYDGGGRLKFIGTHSGRILPSYHKDAMLPGVTMNWGRGRRETLVSLPGRFSV